MLIYVVYNRMHFKQKRLNVIRQTSETDTDYGCIVGCPIFTNMSPNLLDRRYVDIYDISMGNPSFPMPFRSPTKPIHFTKEIENLRGGNGMLELILSQ